MLQPPGTATRGLAEAATRGAPPWPWLYTWGRVHHQRAGDPCKAQLEDLCPVLLPTAFLTSCAFTCPLGRPQRPPAVRDKWTNCRSVGRNTIDPPPSSTLRSAETARRTTALDREQSLMQECRRAPAGVPQGLGRGRRGCVGLGASAGGAMKVL